MPVVVSSGAERQRGAGATQRRPGRAGPLGATPARVPLSGRVGAVGLCRRRSVVGCSPTATQCFQRQRPGPGAQPALSKGHARCRVRVGDCNHAQPRSFRPPPRPFLQRLPSRCIPLSTLCPRLATSRSNTRSPGQGTRPPGPDTHAGARLRLRLGSLLRTFGCAEQLLHAPLFIKPASKPTTMGGRTHARTHALRTESDGSTAVEKRRRSGADRRAIRCCAMRTVGAASHGRGEGALARAARPLAGRGGPRLAAAPRRPPAVQTHKTK